MVRRLRMAMLCLALAATLLAVAGCKPRRNMERQPNHGQQRPTLLFLDGMSERPLVTGVVPRPPQQVPGVPYSMVRTTIPANFPATAPSRDIPFPITREVVERGQQRFNIYCAVCHGSLGDGDGMIPRRGFQRPPSFHIERLRKTTDAHFYDVITNGYGTMFSYSERVAPDDRWAITAYIRALQAGVQGNSSLTAEQRRQLEQSP